MKANVMTRITSAIGKECDRYRARIEGSKGYAPFISLTVLVNGVASVLMLMYVFFYQFIFLFVRNIQQFDEETLRTRAK
jgi:hypothetical protein